MKRRIAKKILKPGKIGCIYRLETIKKARKKLKMYPGGCSVS